MIIFVTKIKQIAFEHGKSQRNRHNSCICHWRSFFIYWYCFHQFSNDDFYAFHIFFFYQEKKPSEYELNTNDCFESNVCDASREMEHGCNVWSENVVRLKKTYLITGFISVLCKSDCNSTNSTHNCKNTKRNTNKTSWKLVLNLPTLCGASRVINERRRFLLYLHKTKMIIWQKQKKKWTKWQI